MSENTSIEWCDHTFNSWEGCQKVGPGCDHCYAETRNARFGGGTAVNWGAGAPRRRTSPANWRKPLAWDRAHAEFFAAHGRRQRVFCASLADVFDNAVDPAWRRDLFDLIELTPNLDWLLLTKRIGNVFEMVARAKCHDWLAGRSNVWLGATICNQEEADRDIPKLLAMPARVRFLSMEPLLGPVSFEGIFASDVIHDGTNALEALDWIIAGGESGPGARGMHPDWVRSLRDQCAAVSTPFLLKQWGEWKPVTDKGEVEQYPTFVKRDPRDGRNTSSGCFHMQHQTWACVEEESHYGWRYPVIKVGKRAAGRLLDGVQHDGYPEVRP